MSFSFLFFDYLSLLPMSLSFPPSTSLLPLFIFSSSYLSPSSLYLSASLLPISLSFPPTSLSFCLSPSYLFIFPSYLSILLPLSFQSLSSPPSTSLLLPLSFLSLYLSLLPPVLQVGPYSATVQPVCHSRGECGGWQGEPRPILHPWH